MNERSTVERSLALAVGLALAGAAGLGGGRVLRGMQGAQAERPGEPVVSLREAVAIGVRPDPRSLLVAATGDTAPRVGAAKPRVGRGAIGAATRGGGIVPAGAAESAERTARSVVPTAPSPGAAPDGGAVRFLGSAPAAYAVEGRDAGAPAAGHGASAGWVGGDGRTGDDGLGALGAALNDDVDEPPSADAGPREASWRWNGGRSVEASYRAVLRRIGMSISRDAADERRDIASGKVPLYLTEKARAAARSEGRDPGHGPAAPGTEGPRTGGDDVLRPGGPTAPAAPTRGSAARPPRAPLEQTGIVFPDLSYAQRGRIEDWDALARASRGVIALKVRQTKVDPFFSAGGLEEVERRGMIVIGYAYGYGVDGAEQADALLRSFRPQPGRVYALDLEGNPFRNAALREEPGKRQGDMTPRQAVAFVQRIVERTGNLPVVYVGASFRRDALPRYPTAEKFLARCPAWIAAYTRASAHGVYAQEKAAIWQFTSSGAFPGVSRKGGLDLNELRVTYGTLRAWAGLAAPAPPIVAGGPFQGFGSLAKAVLARAWLVADHIRGSGGFRPDGENDAYGFIRRAWDPFLAALGRPALARRDAPNSEWVLITDWHALRPGDIVATHPGHAEGSTWHGGLFAGMKFGVPWIFDNVPGLGPSGHAHDGRFKFFHRPTHELLIEKDGPLASRDEEYRGPA